MSAVITENHHMLRELPGGLRLRRATPADAEALAAFNSRIHSDHGPDQPDEKIGAWTHDLLTRPHPTFNPDDFTIVDDPATGTIVSSLNLISQMWAYEGIPFGVGRPEVVGTAPEFRNRGLVRAQFDLIHQWSAERGHRVQGITGIPYYYRQFGYEMALTLGGVRAAFEPNVPELKAGQAEPYPLRPATEADTPLLQELADILARRCVVSSVRDEALWRYELSGRSEWNVNRTVGAIILSEAGEAVGAVFQVPWLWEGGPGRTLAVPFVELRPGVSWLEVMPSLLRQLWAVARGYGERDGKPVQRVSFVLGTDHPVYQAIPGSLPLERPAYGWYLRVADVPGFLRHITPALERRLAESIASGHSGELKVSFYRSGLRLVLERGRLATIEPWQPTPADGGSAGFPGLTFLQLLFGYHSLDELRGAFPDCWVDNDTARGLLAALFPKRPSTVWAIA